MIFSRSRRPDPDGGANDPGCIARLGLRAKILGAALLLSGLVYCLAWLAAHLAYSPFPDAALEPEVRFRTLPFFLAGLAVAAGAALAGGGALARSVLRPIRELASAMTDRAGKGSAGSIDLPDRDRETSELRASLNALLVTLVPPPLGDPSLAQPGERFRASPDGREGTPGGADQCAVPGVSEDIVEATGHAAGPASGNAGSSSQPADISSGLSSGSGAGTLGSGADGASPADRADGPEVGSGGQNGLNERQRRGLDFAVRTGAMSRAQYQAAAGPNVPARTAQYDLREMVEKGCLQVVGKGPATRYIPAGEALRRK